jgi:hypothetical protein
MWPSPLAGEGGARSAPGEGGATDDASDFAFGGPEPRPDAIRPDEGLLPAGDR